MNRWYLVSAASIILTALMVSLWLLIPGFPLLIFLLFPPLFWWGSRKGNEESDNETERQPAPLLLCPHCGKPLLEPAEEFCPRCGARLRDR
jgi:type III secretory pathway component EscV